MKSTKPVEGGRLKVTNLVRVFESDGEKVVAVDNVSFEVQPGEFFSLLGPSGCGKTTTLRCVAGLDTPASGVIEVHGQVVFSSEDRISEPAHARDLGMVFQSYAIWPHMSVFDNVAFPLKNRRGQRTRSQDIKGAVERALATVQLDGLEDRMATKLSGGQQQRLALARALVTEPSLILLDEPLSNLDAGLRDRMRGEIRALQQSTGVTSLYVTHDQTEAFSLSSRIAVMHQGRIVQIGEPREIYAEPASAYVATFVGRTNLLPATKVSQLSDAPGALEVETSAGTLAGRMPSTLQVSEVEGVVVRPEDIEISLDPISADRGTVLQGTIMQTSYLGALDEFDVKVGSALLVCQQFARESIPAGTEVYLRIPADRCRAVTGIADLADQQEEMTEEVEMDSIDLFEEEGVLPLG